jgi:hypothetical protein
MLSILVRESIVLQRLGGLHRVIAGQYRSEVFSLLVLLVHAINAGNGTHWTALLLIVSKGAHPQIFGKLAKRTIVRHQYD